MGKQQLQNLVEAYIKDAIENTTNGSFIWSNGQIEEFLQHSIPEAEMQEIEDLLLSNDCIAEAEVYTDDNNNVVIDCMFWLDYCAQTCRSAILFHNTKTDDKWYLEYAELCGTEQDEETDKILLKEANKLIKNDYDASSIKSQFELENATEATGIRNILKTVEFQ